jgi:hypothetical protein
MGLDLAEMEAGLASDYDIFQDGLRAFGLLVLTLSPVVAAGMRGR